MGDFVLGGAVLEVVQPAAPVFQAVQPAAGTVVQVMPMPGPKGDQGIGSGIAYVQATPVSSIAIPHSLGRLPVVVVYVTGEEVETDVSADTGHAYLSFPTPTAFTAVLT